MNADGNEAVTICHGLKLSYSLWDSQAGGTTKQLRLEIIRPAPRDKLPPGIHT